MGLRPGRKRKSGDRYPCGKLRRDPPAPPIPAVKDEPRTYTVLGAKPPKKLAIYVVRCGSAVKIGFSRNPGQRLSDLQTSQPDRIELRWWAWLPPKLAPKIERAVHKELKAAGMHLSGEWFFVKTPTAIAVVLRVAKEFGCVFEGQRFDPIAEASFDSMVCQLGFVDGVGCSPLRRIRKSYRNSEITN